MSFKTITDWDRGRREHELRVEYQDAVAKLYGGPPAIGSRRWSQRFLSWHEQGQDMTDVVPIGEDCLCPTCGREHR